jgi:hypothetical protein
MMYYKLILFSLLITLARIPAWSQTKASQSFTFFAFGDLPYNIPSDEIRFQNLIDTLNKENQAFTIHVGDIKSGSTPCADEIYEKALTYFNKFNKPLIYIPGDNEWTDCGRIVCGSYDPLERLSMVRKMFFKDEKSFGKQSIQLISQRRNLKYSKFVENNRWHYNNIMFATIHVVGTNNNFIPDYKNFSREFYERDSANISWLEEIFEDAIKNKNIGIVIALHADMFDNSDETSGFARLISSLKRLTIQFNKPVLLINGDSHKFLIDKPIIKDPQTMKVLNNFSRVQVFGAFDANAVKIIVNPANPNLFEIHQFFVLKN